MVLNFAGRNYPATATADGLLSAAQYTLLADLDGLPTNLGSADEQVPGADVAVAATTVVQLATITLAPGIWLLWGWANVLMGAGAGVVDLYLREGTTQLAGTITTLTIAAAGQAGAPTPMRRVTPTVSTAYNLAAYATAACTGRALGVGAGGFNNGMGIRAVRLQ